MKEYVKLSISFKERILFLITGLINKEHIISKDIGNVTPIPTVNTREVVTIDKEDDAPLSIGSIPFFELDESETKSNLNE